ncbi:MAG: hypothetical protein ACI87W_003179, partial [Halieaceae bacterium]
AKFWRVPAGWNLSRVGVDENLHVHTTVYEYGAFMKGTFPHIEYDVNTQRRWKMEFSPGDLMIRPPGSVHGLDSSMLVPEETILLYCNSGPGTSILDPDYALETADVMDGAIRSGVATDGVCRIDRPLDHVPIEDDECKDYSLPGEPAHFTIRRLKPGGEATLDELLGGDGLFCVLWQGNCRLEGTDGLSVDISEWDTVLHGSEPDSVAGGAFKNLATKDAFWLCVKSG